MILLVDLGNSSLRWSVLSQGKLQDPRQLDHRGRSGPDWPGEIWNNLTQPERVMVASVAGSGKEQELASWIRTTWSLKMELLVPQPAAFGVTNAYKEPTRLGADRWAALLAVHHMGLGDACIVDCGTAITADAIRGDGTHLGGWICPGLQLMHRSLAEGTMGVGILQDLEIANAGEPAGNTETAVAAGTLLAAAALADRIFSQVCDQFGGPVAALLTGGDAPAILPLLSHRVLHDPALVLRGLAIATGVGE